MYGVIGGVTHNYTWGGLLQSNEEAIVNLPSISVGTGNFTLNVEAVIANDENNTNDNLSQNFSGNTSGAFNVINSFESAQDELIVQNGVWERGVPTGSVLNNAATGTQVYGTNLSGNYPADATASLQSNCYDFTQLINPVLKFQMAYSLEENWDWANVQYSIDSGVTWENLGTVNSQPNWYNSDNDGSGFGCLECPGAQWTGTNTTMTSYGYNFTENAALGEADLTSADNIMFRMTLHSDNIFHEEGIILDDFVVEGNEGLQVAPKVYLQGAALNPNAGEESLMRDNLRLSNLIPTTSPYSDKLSCSNTVFNTSGADAIVDWVWVELRDETNNNIVRTSQSALLQRDGDIVDVDGTSTLQFLVPSGNYNIAVKHRNHLGIITNTALNIAEGSVTIVDFTNANNLITFGTNAQTIFGMPNGVVGMWAGDANTDGRLNYLGALSDIPSIRSQVFNDPNNSVFGGPPVGTYQSIGYHTTDVDMNGFTVYSGSTTDALYIRDNIFNNPSNAVFGGPPTAT